MPVTSSSFGKDPSHADDAVSLSEVISAMTFALDLTEGAVAGHGLRSCLLGMRIAETLRLPMPLRASLYYALQLKDVGCSSNAARVTKIVGGGDDRSMKAATKLNDWSHPARTIRSLWPYVMPDGHFFPRVARFIKIGFSRSRNNKALTELRCERGAEIVRKLDMGEVTAEAVRRLDEMWDGTGYPGNLRGTQIPLLARICAVAQNLDVFAGQVGPDAAMALLQKRSGAWFDPNVVRTAKILHDAGILWKDCRAGDDLVQTRRAVMELDPGMGAQLIPERIDTLCEAFASVVDAKSPFTYRHSMGVAEVAEELAKELGLAPERVQLVRRAALLHDVGKLKVSNSILDKTGSLTPDEWKLVKEHPAMSRSILERVTAFRELAVIAGEHHERCDGSGYPLGLTAEQMSIEARLVAVADAYSALAEERPYREAIAPGVILKILSADVPQKLDASCFQALTAVVARQSPKARIQTWTPAETDVTSLDSDWAAQFDEPVLIH